MNRGAHKFMYIGLFIYSQLQPCDPQLSKRLLSQGYHDLCSSVQMNRLN